VATHPCLIVANASHINLQVNQEQQERQGCTWNGETTFVDCEFDPEEFLVTVANERKAFSKGGPVDESVRMVDTFGLVDVSTKDYLLP